MLPFYADLMANDACRLVSTPQASSEILSPRTHATPLSRQAPRRPQASAEKAS